MVDNKEVMAKNIKYYMDLHHLNAQDMCRIFGFKQPTFSDWVNAKNYPRIDKIEKMANYFNISKAFLVEDWQKNRTYWDNLSQETVHYVFGEDEVLEVYRSLPDTQRARLLAYAEGLKAGMKNDD